MARNCFSQSVLLGLAFCFWAGGTLCLGQNSSLLVATRPRYALRSSHLDEAVPNNVELNTSRVVEVIPTEYRKRYLKWRNDYLSTAAGHSHWNRYALDPNFTLTITVSKQLAEGAIVDGFQWDDDGSLQAATIRLGYKLNSGYPSPVEYPITCSLSKGELPAEVTGTILAATKIAHEFGHLDRIRQMNRRFYELQNILAREYNRIFNLNGHDCRDPRLLTLVAQMKGTPVSIMKDREAWAEAGALLYLQERLAKDRKIRMPKSIKQAIESYYSMYPGRL